MADTLKDELLLGGGIRHLTATSQYNVHIKQVPACASLNVFIFGNIVCLHERMFNCCNVLMSKLKFAIK